MMLPRRTQEGFVSRYLTRVKPPGKKRPPAAARFEAAEAAGPVGSKKGHGDRESAVYAGRYESDFARPDTGGFGKQAQRARDFRPLRFETARMAIVGLKEHKMNTDTFRDRWRDATGTGCGMLRNHRACRRTRSYGRQGCPCAGPVELVYRP